jgi:hypothetical protein
LVSSNSSLSNIWFAAAILLSTEAAAATCGWCFNNWNTYEAPANSVPANINEGTGFAHDFECCCWKWGQFLG